MQCRISIIIPVYNVEPYIEECLNSVMNQTFQEGVECIVVDDCGQDNSMALAERMIGDYYGDVEFSVLHHEQNRGQSAARNTGLSVAKGEYVFFLDSDDSISADCFEVMWKLTEKYKGVDLIQGTTSAEGNRTGYVNVDMLKRCCDRDFLDDDKLVKKVLLDSECLPVTPWNRLIKRKLLIDNKILFHEGIVYEDVPWTFFVSKYVKRMAFCHKPTYSYRVNPKGTMSARTERSHYCWNVGFDDMFRRLSADDYARKIELKYIMKWICHYQWNYHDNPLKGKNYEGLGLYELYLNNHLKRISSRTFTLGGLLYRIRHYLLDSLLMR